MYFLHGTQFYLSRQLFETTGQKECSALLTSVFAPNAKVGPTPVSDWICLLKNCTLPHKKGGFDELV
jgi:hypothetical protein